MSNDPTARCTHCDAMGHSIALCKVLTAQNEIKNPQQIQRQNQPNTNRQQPTEPTANSNQSNTYRGTQSRNSENNKGGRSDENGNTRTNSYQNNYRNNQNSNRFDNQNYGTQNQNDNQFRNYGQSTQFARLDPFQYAPYPLASQSTTNLNRPQIQIQQRTGGLNLQTTPANFGSMPNLNIHQQANPHIQYPQQPDMQSQNQLSQQGNQNQTGQTKTTRAINIEEEFQPPFQNIDHPENYIG